MIERTYDTILECFYRKEYLTAMEILQILRDNNEPSIHTDLPWEVRGILTELHDREVLIYNPIISAYKRIDWE
jgi:hypothetical protein